MKDFEINMFPKQTWYLRKAATPSVQITIWSGNESVPSKPEAVPSRIGQEGMSSVSCPVACHYKY